MMLAPSMPSRISFRPEWREVIDGSMGDKIRRERLTRETSEHFRAGPWSVDEEADHSLGDQLT